MRDIAVCDDERVYLRDIEQSCDEYGILRATKITTTYLNRL